MHTIYLIAALVAFSLAVNIPCGYLRTNYDKFTFGWYFYVHISIPAIIYLRVKSGISWHMIPFTLAAAILGQIIGGALHARRQQQ
ncbi:MAG TPA: hypothetical protein VFR01_00015 [Geobacterales bacterium]|nr:hypothetical protein [Geobacterales bacterium]